MNEEELMREVKSQLEITHNRMDSFMVMHLRNKRHNVKETVAKLRRRRAMEKDVFGNLRIIREMSLNLGSGIMQAIGYDFDGRQVFYVNTRREIPKKSERDMKRTLFDMFFSYGTRLRDNYQENQCIWIVNQRDASAWTNTDITFQAEICLRISKFWPGAMHRVYVINMSTILAGIVRGLISRLPESLRTIIHVVSEDDLRNGRYLLETMPPEVVPIELGGLNDCDDEDHWRAFCDDVEAYALQMQQGIEEGKWMKEKEYELYVNSAIKHKNSMRNFVFEDDDDISFGRGRTPANVGADAQSLASQQQQQQQQPENSLTGINFGLDMQQQTPFYSREISTMHSKYQRRNTLVLLDRYATDSFKVAKLCEMMTKELVVRFARLSEPVMNAKAMPEALGPVLASHPLLWEREQKRQQEEEEEDEHELRAIIGVFPSYYLGMLRELLRFALHLSECTYRVIEDLRAGSFLLSINAAEVIEDFQPNGTDPLLQYLLEARRRRRRSGKRKKKGWDKRTPTDPAAVTSLYDYLVDCSKEAEILEKRIREQEELVEIHFEVLSCWDRMYQDVSGLMPATKDAIVHLLERELEAAEKQYRTQLNRTRYHEGCFFLFHKLSQESTDAAMNLVEVEPLLPGAVRALLNAATSPAGEPDPFTPSPSSPMASRLKHRCLFCPLAEGRRNWESLAAFEEWNNACDVLSRARLISEGKVQVSSLHGISLHDLPKCADVIKSTIFDVDQAAEEFRQTLPVIDENDESDDDDDDDTLTPKGSDGGKNALPDVIEEDLNATRKRAELRQRAEVERFLHSLIPLTRLVRDARGSFAREAKKLFEAQVDVLAIERRLFLLERGLQSGTTYDEFLLRTNVLVHTLARNRRLFAARKQAVHFLHEQLGLLDEEVTALYNDRPTQQQEQQQQQREITDAAEQGDDNNGAAGTPTNPGSPGTFEQPPTLCWHDWTIPPYVLQLEDAKMEKGATVKFCVLHDNNLKLAHALLRTYITFVRCFHHSQDNNNDNSEQLYQEGGTKQREDGNGNTQQHSSPPTNFNDPAIHRRAALVPTKQLIGVREIWSNIVSECLIYMRSLRTTHSELTWQLQMLRK